MRSLLFILLIGSVSFTFPSAGNESNVLGFHKVKAVNGDGVYSLLRRFELLDHQCNVDKFYELNHMQEGDQLIRNKMYQIPVLVYTYNGKSIRSTIGINDWDLASRIALFNRKLKSKRIRSTNYLDSNILWVPYHELGCNDISEDDVEPTEEAELVKNPTLAKPAPAFIKTSVNTFKVPYLGKGYEDITLRSEKLKNKIFYIVSGHGGPDPGAMAELNGRDLCEDEYAYDVSLRLARNLLEHGATVHMIIQDPDDGIRSEEILTCDKEELCMGKYDIPLDQVARLHQRTEVVNKMHQQYKNAGIYDQQVICIHVDSRSPKKRQDVFFYYYAKSRTGMKKAYQLQETFKDKYKKYRSNGQYHGTVSARPLYVLKFTDPTAVYVELANIQNSNDQRRILPASNRQALANWLYEGLVAE